MSITQVLNYYPKAKEAFERFPYIQNAVNNCKTEAQAKVIKEIIEKDIETLTKYIEALSYQLDEWWEAGHATFTCLRIIKERAEYLHMRELLSREQYVINDIILLHEIKRQIKEGSK